ncbi:MAG TPA: peptide-methionine (R)-S-oxide reductase, partial [Actinomycetota bacterium]|nr:peptide-methionine (R)-S-oxide reductase [Actinomycetota bacterium]
MPEVTRTEQEWREQLSADQYRVLREAGTEPPFTGEYTYAKEEGVYR